MAEAMRVDFEVPAAVFSAPQITEFRNRLDSALQTLGWVVGCEKDEVDQSYHVRVWSDAPESAKLILWGFLSGTVGWRDPSAHMRVTKIPLPSA